MARFLKINLGDVNDFTAAEIELLCEERQKEIENERSFWEHLVAWLVVTILNIVSKRKYKIKDVLKRKDGNAASRFQTATAELNRSGIENVRR